MCLPVKPYKVEKEWIHAGLQCAVVQAREGQYRCGYVRVPPGHPKFGMDYDAVHAEVHGGLTFGELEPCTEHADGQGWWFGFDCIHAGDAYWDPDVDPATLSAETRELREVSLGIDRKYPKMGEMNVFRDQLYVERECESLAEQLAAVAS